MIIPNIRENKKCSKPANQQHSLVSANMASREILSKCKFIAGENQLPVVDFCIFFTTGGICLLQEKNIKVPFSASAGKQDCLSGQRPCEGWSSYHDCWYIPSGKLTIMVFWNTVDFPCSIGNFIIPTQLTNIDQPPTTIPR